MSYISRRSNNPPSRTSRSEGQEEFTFQLLPYSTIRISNENKLASKISTDTGYRKLTRTSIVYFNRDLRFPPDKLILRVEKSHVPPTRVPGSHSYAIGFTTCDPVKVFQHPRHFTDYCRPEYDCRGKSRWMKIFKDTDFVGTHIALERIRPGAIREEPMAIVKITITHGQNVRSLTMVDPDNVFVSGIRPCYPFIIFSGSVFSMKIVKEIETAPIVNPVLGRPTAATSLSQRRSRIHSDLIRVEGRCIERLGTFSSSELYYTFNSNAFKMNQTLTFVVSKVDQEIEGSISFGVTTCQPESITLECLPIDCSELLTTPYSKNWKVNVDIITERPISPGKYFSIKRTVGGFTLKLAPKNIRTLFYSDPEKTVYPFFQFNGCVKKINVVSNAAPIFAAASAMASALEDSSNVRSPPRSPSVRSNSYITYVSQSDSFPPESWIHCNLISIEGGCIERLRTFSSSELYYAFSYSAFEMNRTLTFFVSEVDQEIEGSISFGVTTYQPESINLECLPNDCSELLTTRYNKNWKVNVDIITEQPISPGKYFSIERTVGGFTLKLAPIDRRFLFYLKPEETVYPFFKFNGCVKKIIVSNAPPTFAAVSAMASALEDPPIVRSPPRSPSVRPDSCVNSLSQSDSFPPESWIHCNLISIEGGCIERLRTFSSSELYYSFSSNAFEMNRTLTFVVSEVDQEIEGSISFGVTTCQPESITLECLPNDCSELLTTPYNKNWTVDVDIITERPISPGKYFSIKRTVGGFTLNLAPNNSRTLFYFDPEKKVYPFFQFNGCIKKINVAPTFAAASAMVSALEDSSNIRSPPQSPSVRSDSSEHRGKCVICLEDVADHACDPCFHVCYCEKCAQTVKMGLRRSVRMNQCPVCRERLQDIRKLYLP